MSKIVMGVPVGKPGEVSGDTIAQLPEIRGARVGFLSNGHLSIVPFWNCFEAEVQSRWETIQITSYTKPNTFAPAPDDIIQDMASKSEIAFAGVCA